MNLADLNTWLDYHYWARDIILGLQQLSHAKDADFSKSYVGTTAALSAESMWECTTCAACVEACPVSIEQMPKIVGTRRFLVMEEAEFPETMQQALTSVETRGHPFRGTAFSRVDWARGLPIATVAEARDVMVAAIVGWVRTFSPSLQSRVLCPKSCREE